MTLNKEFNYLISNVLLALIEIVKTGQLAASRFRWRYCNSESCAPRGIHMKVLAAVWNRRVTEISRRFSGRGTASAVCASAVI